MKAKFAFLVFIIFAISCSKPSKTPDTPAALQQKNTELDFSYKRGDEDLVNSLYTELAKKTPELNDLEEQINALKDSEADSLKSFVNYNSKSDSYYTEAERMTAQLTDSVLKNKIRLLVEKSQSNYKASTTVQKKLLGQIDLKNISINDLHILLKVSKTLPLIEKYQLKNKPTTSPITGYIKEMDKVIKLADTLSKK
jgi:hypothetical protein